MNSRIIELFELLVKQTIQELNTSKTTKEKTANRFRLLNTQNVLEIIKNYPQQIKSGDDLSMIKGVGKGSVERINEIIKTGSLKEIKSTKKYDKYAKHIAELEQVFGIGTNKAFELVTKNKIKTVQELKDAYKNKKIELTRQIVVGLKYHGLYMTGIPRSEMDKINKLIQRETSMVDPELSSTLCGSFRRGKPFSNDVDVLVSHPSIKTKKDVVSKKNFMRMLIKRLKKIGFILDDLTFDKYTTKYMGFCRLGENPVRRMDIYYTSKDSYPAALLHLTGSAKFNQMTRGLAVDLGYTLNEYGLFKIDNNKKKKIDAPSEAAILKKLGLDYVSPDKR